MSLVDSDTKGVGFAYPLRVECVQDRTTIRQCSRSLTASSASTGNGLHAAASPDLPRLPVGGAERKTGWEINGDADPYGIQYLLNRARWSVAEVRAALRGYVQEHLRGPRAVGIVDETAFLKKGIRSAGVARQYSGTTERVENCQVGIFLAYTGARGYTLPDSELYLTEGWINEPTPAQQLRGLVRPAPAPSGWPCTATTAGSRPLRYAVPVINSGLGHDPWPHAQR